MTEQMIRQWMETRPPEERDRLYALMRRYEELLLQPDALIAEVRLQGQKPHVMADAELSLLLGLLVGRVRDLQTFIDGVFETADRMTRPDGREH